MVRVGAAAAAVVGDGTNGTSNFVIRIRVGIIIYTTVLGLVYIHRNIPYVLYNHGRTVQYHTIAYIHLSSLE